MVRTIDAGPIEAWTVALTPNGQTLASGSQGGHVPNRDLKMSMVGKEHAYLRTVISRFGGIIRVGTAVQTPPQTWEKGKWGG